MFRRTELLVIIHGEIVYQSRGTIDYVVILNCRIMSLNS